MLKAIIFDMDGVLVDSEPLHYRSNVMALERLGKKIDYEYYEQFIGSTVKYLWECLKEKYQLSLSVEELMELGDECKRELLEKEGYPPIPGVKEMVRRCKDAGLKTAIASSSSSASIKEVTTYFGIDGYIDQFASGLEVKNRKPAPDVYLKAADLIHVLPEECIVVEDSSIGVTAAKAAGMVCIGYVNPHSGKQDLSKADYLIESHDAITKQFLEMVYAHTRQEP